MIHFCSKSIHRRLYSLPGRFFFLTFFFATTTFGQPNVLFIVADDLNTRIGAYGDAFVKTPNLNKLAREGVRFDQAYANYPQCMGSRASFLTGLYPDQNGVFKLHQRFRDTVPAVKTLPQVFRESGYHTAAVGKVFHFNVPQSIGSPNYNNDPISWSEHYNPAGIDRTSADRIEYLGPHMKEKQKNSNINGGWLSLMRLGGGRTEYTDGKITNQALRILSSRAKGFKDEPFFLAVGYIRPHVPFAAPEHFFNLYPTSEISLTTVSVNDRNDMPTPQLSDRPYQLDMTDQQKKEMIQGYYASTTFLDDEIGRLIQKLEELGLRKSTLIVFVSDHGFLLGEHDLWQKPSLFEQALRIPLIVSAPDKKQIGVSSNAIVELVDIYPTILELAGIDLPGHNSGKSFAEILDKPEDSMRKSALSMSYSHAGSSMRPGVSLRDTLGYSIKTDNFRYTEWDGGIHGAELYDHRSDPKESNNLFSNPEYSNDKNRLRIILQERISSARESREYLQQTR